MKAVSTGFIVSYGVLTKLNGSAMPDTINNWPVPVNPPYNPPVTPPEDPSEPPVEEELPEVDPPLSDLPGEEPSEEEIPEEDPPLADVPETSDMTALWAAMSAVSAAGVFFLGKKNKDEE